MTTGTLFNIQRLSIHDGPGIRTSVFFKGCNLRCKWCHNPEGQSMKTELRFIASKCISCGDCIKNCPHPNGTASAIFTPKCVVCGECADNCFSGALSIVGKLCTADELLDEIKLDAAAFSISGGGVTFTGGEPLLQPEFLAGVLKLCKNEGIHTAVETALCVPNETVQELVSYVDLFICDIKSADSKKHLAQTGAGNEQILQNIRFLSASKANMLLRTPIIPGFNDDEISVTKIKEFIDTLPAKHTWELIPFHNMCSEKYPAVGKKWEMHGVEVPSKTKMEYLREITK